ncbi:hypothetical protein FC51_GL000198 [Lentilactobacillus parabuchneri DSM 5707 = NBRC 107865]|uniref:GIY-YIG domain-containing protein n=1 Tax=Lentilactobacillus parabuchneri DSM 5707 = NBRC 107865 TaxID=1423784 RepID=A0A0R1YYI1_9LACO|nr:hypothetical protein FC51_GL000198 [Lentilactobacillus parabuchneri DSM 5707 = NBRC 107865]KRN80260.1 hypothetical protein IV42_GL000580 [Lentilactobacillus parabuchneri]
MNGTGAKYTRSHQPLKILFKKQFVNKHDALSAEYAFKQLTRSQKLNYLEKQGIKLK